MIDEDKIMKRISKIENLARKYSDYAGFYQGGADELKKNLRGAAIAPKCGWLENEDGAWKTSCGNMYEFSNPDGPSGNGQKYCGYCGKPILEVRCWSDSDEE